MFRGLFPCYSARVVPTRGTTAVVGKAFSEGDIPTVELEANDISKGSVRIPTEKLARVTSFPTLLRIKVTEQPVMIVQLLKDFSSLSGAAGDAVYHVDWQKPRGGPVL